MPKGICSPFEKNSILHLVMMLGACFCSHVGIAADIDSVLVRQQWPWSTDVKVEYRLSNVTSPVDIKVECFNNGTPLTVENIDKAITGKTYSLSKGDEGIRFFYIDPVKAFGKSQVSLANFTVKLTLSEANALDSEPIYKIIDLETKQVTDLSRADFYNDRGRKYGTYETDFAAIGSSPSKGTPYTTSLENVFIWTGVTNDIAYKTTKLVMRRISAKNKTFMMGSNPEDYTRWSSDSFYFETSFTNDYYIGVFEITRSQYALMENGSASSVAESDLTQPYPIDSYVSIRGNPTEWDNWPVERYSVGEDSFLNKVRNKYQGCFFDLPTEAQWEYACRAGTDTMNYSGIATTSAVVSSNDLKVLAWCIENSDKISHPVGELRPNAFGLYDMLGNVAEMARDVFDMLKMDGSHPPPIESTGVDPIGWSDVSEITAAVNDRKCGAVYRGGCWDRNYTFVRVPARREQKIITSGWSTHLGFRLWLYAD